MKKIGLDLSSHEEVSEFNKLQRAYINFCKGAPKEISKDERESMFAPWKKMFAAKTLKVKKTTMDKVPDAIRKKITLKNMSKVPS